MLDINSLLATEQISLLKARFSCAVEARDHHLVLAAEAAKMLRGSRYPHRRLAFEMLT